jgi:hypothetical protein
MQRGATAFAAPVHIHRVERLLGLLRSPGGSERLPATLPSITCRLNPAGIERQRRAGHCRTFALGRGNDLRCVVGAALVGLVQADYIRSVEVCLADVAAWLTAVEVTRRRINAGEGVLDLAELVDRISQGSEGGIGRHDTIIGRSTVVLHFLDEDEVRCVQVVDQMSCDFGQMCRRRGKVLNVVAADGDGVTLAAAAKGGRRCGDGGIDLDLDGGEGEDGVESVGLLHYANDVF